MGTLPEASVAEVLEYIANCCVAFSVVYLLADAEPELSFAPGFSLLSLAERKVTNCHMSDPL